MQAMQQMLIIKERRQTSEAIKKQQATIRTPPRGKKPEATKENKGNRPMGRAHNSTRQPVKH
jgi:hypothetical protein